MLEPPARKSRAATVTPEPPKDPAAAPWSQTFGRRSAALSHFISTKARIKLETILEAVQKNSQANPTEYGVVVPPKLVLKTFPKESANPTPARQERTGSRSLEDGILAHLREAREPATTQA